MKQSQVLVQDHFLSLHSETIDPPVLLVLRLDTSTGMEINCSNFKVKYGKA